MKKNSLFILAAAMMLGLPMGAMALDLNSTAIQSTITLQVQPSIITSGSITFGKWYLTSSGFNNTYKIKVDPLSGTASALTTGGANILASAGNSYALGSVTLNDWNGASYVIHTGSTQGGSEGMISLKNTELNSISMTPYIWVSGPVSEAAVATTGNEKTAASNAETIYIGGEITMPNTSIGNTGFFSGDLYVKIVCTL